MEITMDIATVSKNCSTITKEVRKAIIGKDDVLEKVIWCILADGHILFEDYPGLAKTLMAKSFASGCKFTRIQFTPDLLPADITGTKIYNRKTMEFELREGPIFTNILLADEINRAPPKTQSALLEAMQERQTTIEGETRKMEKPFIVLATQNPIEYEGTYPLPEAQVDRFLARLNIGYPSKEDEQNILERRIERKMDDVQINRIIDPNTLLEMQKAVENVHIHKDIIKYIVEIVTKTRTHPPVEVGASPRGSLSLLKLARARAAFYGKDFVIPDDVKINAESALAHRIILKPEPWMQGIKPESIINSILASVPVPKLDRGK